MGKDYYKVRPGSTLAGLSSRVGAVLLQHPPPPPPLGAYRRSRPPPLCRVFARGTVNLGVELVVSAQLCRSAAVLAHAQLPLQRQRWHLTVASHSWAQNPIPLAPHVQILGVERDANDDQVRTARFWRWLALLLLLLLLLVVSRQHAC